MKLKLNAELLFLSLDEDMKKDLQKSKSFYYLIFYSQGRNQYIPPMPPIPPVGSAAEASGSGIVATAASVVNSKADTDAAFCKAERVTFVGSIIPASIMSTSSPVNALNPIPFSLFFRRSMITPPSTPAFLAI